MSPFTVVLSIILLAGTIQAGIIGGHYGGHFDDNAETHDFSEGLANIESSNYESLGSLGEHLKESHFPSDYGHEFKGGEYEEGAASEHFEHGGYEHQHFPHFEHESIGSLHGIHSELHDFDTKPVPGINHGKGALSYSTTYEFKDPKP